MLQKTAISLVCLSLLGLPVVATAETIVLYDGETGFNALPNYGLGANGTRKLAYAEVPLPSLTSPSPKASGIATNLLNTDMGQGQTGYAGYSNYGLKSLFPSIQFGLLQADFPTLNRSEGFSFTLEVAVTAESSNPNRAGFSMLLTAEDGQGIELGFKAENGGRIFAQSATFTEAETAAFDISQKTTYQLRIKDDEYFLSTGDTVLLTGPVRSYEFDPNLSDPPLPLNPYSLPNMFFLGDNTDQGNATVEFGTISFTTGDPVVSPPTDPTEPTEPTDTPPVLDLVNLPELSRPLACAENVRYPQRTDLLGAGLLGSINQLEIIQAAGWRFEQNPEYGYLSLALGDKRYAVQPLRINQSSTTETGAGLIGTDTIQFITPEGAEIIAPPAVQAPCALQVALAELGLPNYQVEPSGNIRIAVDSTTSVLLRPDLAITSAGEAVASAGLVAVPAAESAAIITIIQNFTDAEEQLWQQMLHTVAADANILARETSDLVHGNGSVRFMWNEQSYQGRLDFIITQGEASGSFDIAELGDINNDSFTDYQINYPYGVQQVLYGIE